MRWSACRGQPPWTPRQRSGENKSILTIHRIFQKYSLLIIQQRGSPKWSDDEAGPEEDWPIPDDSALSWRCGQLWLWHLPDHQRHGGHCLWPLSWGSALWLSSAPGKPMSDIYEWLSKWLLREEWTCRVLRCLSKTWGMSWGQWWRVVMRPQQDSTPWVTQALTLAAWNSLLHFRCADKIYFVRIV